MSVSLTTNSAVTKERITEEVDRTGHRVGTVFDRGLCFRIGMPARVKDKEGNACLPAGVKEQTHEGTSERGHCHEERESERASERAMAKIEGENE